MRLSGEHERLIVMVQFRREDFDFSAGRGFLLFDDLIGRLEDFVAVSGADIFAELDCRGLGRRVVVP